MSFSTTSHHDCHEDFLLVQVSLLCGGGGGGGGGVWCGVVWWCVCVCVCVNSSE